MLTRRQFLKVGVASGVVLAGAGWLATRRGRAPAAGFQWLDERRPAIVTALVPAVLEGALPAAQPARGDAVARGGRGLRSRRLGALARRCRRRSRSSSPCSASRAGRFIVAGVRSAWAEATGEEVTAFLARWRPAASASCGRATRRSRSSSSPRGTATPPRGTAIGYPGPPTLEPQLVMIADPHPRRDRRRLEGRSTPRRSSATSTLEADVVDRRQRRGRRRDRRDPRRRPGSAVVIVEEGPLASSRDFRMREREAYPQLYQESAGRQTAGQGDHDPAGPLRRRLDHRELDLELPHAADAPSPTGATPRPRARRRGRPRPRGSRAWRSGSRSRRGPSRPTRTTTSCAAAARSSASPPPPSAAT